MTVIRDISNIHQMGNSAITVGTFDGVHLGHQTILDLVKKNARERNLLSTVVTFDPHPKKVVGKDKGWDVRILTTTDEKVAVLKTLGIDQVVVIPFSLEFARLSSREFVKTILLDKLQVKAMVVGYDHQFGRNREGGFDELQMLGKALGFSVEQVAQFVKDETPISSTIIRQLLSEGKISEANNLMGRQYEITGTVVHGEKRGGQIGFPTANVQPLDADKVLPAKGVYAIDATVGTQQYKGMMNIGVRPTFDIDSLTLEAHLFNFNDSLYEKQVTIHFKAFVRAEQKFSGIEALREQLEKDKNFCEKL